MNEWLLIAGVVLTALSGVPGYLTRYPGPVTQWVTTLIAVSGSTLGLLALCMFWTMGEGQSVVLPWPIPGAEFAVALDGLAALFLLPVFLVSLVGSVYGLAYWKESEHPDSGRKLRLFYGILTAGMGLLVIARNSILFLFGWEGMALSAFFLVTAEDGKQEAREAGWVYLVATHIATLCLFGLFAILHAASGSFALAPLAWDKVSPRTATLAFTLTLLGFGIKAGIMPLHVWLPGSHAVAPTHVSAILSGVIIKMGIYGLVRITSLIPHPPVEWGEIILALGVASGILGVVFAIGQHDLKRLLAYHSIENIGIIVIGLGLALVGRSLGRSGWIILGLGGSLLHVWNHAFFKSLLFLSAGSVVHATHTREIDHLGGLAKRMPVTAACFLIGSVAICGLPPLNGFVSEFLIYLGLFGTLVSGDGPSYAGAAFAAPALALIGALAIACFAKAYGAVFLGTARTHHADHANEAPWAMLAPLLVLVAACVVIGLTPVVVVPALARAISAWAPELRDVEAELVALAPLKWVSVMSLALLTALAAAGFLLRYRLRTGAVEHGPTWACGYVAPTPRMQYTSSSFAQSLVNLFGRVLRPKTLRPPTLALFPQKSEFQSKVSDVVLDEAALPVFRLAGYLFSRFRVFQQGSVQSYLLYLFIALIALLLWR
jgi:hydrogenase-4 component B